MPDSTASISPIRVLISYAHFDGAENNRRKVLALANKLRADGIDCELDQYYESKPPSKGWPLWMLDELDAATYVLVVCTPTYYRRFRVDEKPGAGLGAIWEGGHITQALYDAAGRNDKFIPIGFGDYSSVGTAIPDPLRKTSYRDASTDEGYIELLRQLTDQPAAVKPALGTTRSLPPNP